MFELTHSIYTDANAAREYLEATHWPNGPVCPHCGNCDGERITQLKGKSTRPGVRWCNECDKPFTVTVGTIFEDSKIPLNKWLLAFRLMASSKKGISAHQLHRSLGITYKSAWFMAHRIREAMRLDAPSGMGGEGQTIQADETYYGDTSKRSKASKEKRRNKHGNKARVVALVCQQTGEARAFHAERATGKTVRDILFTNVHRTSTLVSDESNLYTYVGKAYAKHETVTHWKGEYVNAAGFTTNNVENFFGIFKKGMTGVYHFCGQQHLQRYLDEFAFRYTNRSGVGVNDHERTELALKGAVGKRLTYRRPDNAANA